MAGTDMSALSEPAKHVFSWFLLMHEPGQAMPYLDLVQHLERIGVDPQQLNDGVDELVRAGKLWEESRSSEQGDFLYYRLREPGQAAPAAALGPRSRLSALAQRSI